MVNPWHEKHVTEARLDRACSWEQLIGKAVKTTSPAEWAAALLEKVADKKTVDKPTDNRKKPKKISDNTKPEEKEDGDSAEIMAD